MDKELKINIGAAKTAYENADENGKKLLENLFGKEIFTPNDITERVKTLEDAIEVIGKEHPFVTLLESFMQDMPEHDKTDKDVIAILKLRIICAALNEGWEPKFTKDEWRYTPWFIFYTKEEWNELSDEDKKKGVLFGGNATYGAGDGLVFAYSHYAPSNANANFGSRLCLKSSALARYCGTQFAEIWADYYLI